MFKHKLGFHGGFPILGTKIALAPHLEGVASPPSLRTAGPRHTPEVALIVSNGEWSRSSMILVFIEVSSTCPSVHFLLLSLSIWLLIFYSHGKGVVWALDPTKKSATIFQCMCCAEKTLLQTPLEPTNHAFLPDFPWEALHNHKE